MQPANHEAASLPRGPHFDDRPCVVDTKFRRQLSSQTDMRFLHIPRNMATALLPDVMMYQMERAVGQRQVFELR